LNDETPKKPTPLLSPAPALVMIMTKIRTSLSTKEKVIPLGRFLNGTSRVGVSSELRKSLKLYASLPLWVKRDGQ
jgi:hypothetical protein